MSTSFRNIAILLVAVFFTLQGCIVEDPGPRQSAERAYSMVDFDRIEIGSALHVDIRQGDFYEVKAGGDRRNIEDLIVTREGSTLVIRYRNHRERRHDTFIEITTPELRSGIFSGGTDARISDIVTEGPFDVVLTGGSWCQLSVDAPAINVMLSGGSYMSVRGQTPHLEADLSGASALKGYNLSVSTGSIYLAGASDAEVSVSDVLQVVASGASHLVYRGTPSVSSQVSGASSVHQE